MPHPGSSTSSRRRGERCAPMAEQIMSDRPDPPWLDEGERYRDGQSATRGRRATGRTGSSRGRVGLGKRDLWILRYEVEGPQLGKPSSLAARPDLRNGSSGAHCRSPCWPTSSPSGGRRGAHRPGRREVGLAFDHVVGGAQALAGDWARERVRHRRGVHEAPPDLLPAGRALPRGLERRGRTQVLLDEVLLGWFHEDEDGIVTMFSDVLLEEGDEKLELREPTGFILRWRNSAVSEERLAGKLHGDVWRTCYRNRRDVPRARAWRRT